MSDRDIETYRELGARRMQVYQLREAIRSALEDNRSDFSARRILADTLRAVGADINTVRDAIRQRDDNAASTSASVHASDGGPSDV